MAKRLRISGKNFILPDGRVFYPFGTNSRFELAQLYDPPYEKSLGFTAVRIEFPWWQLGSAPEARLDSAPGRIDPAIWATFIRRVRAYTSIGMWVFLAPHSKCGRQALLDDGVTPDPYCGDTVMWPPGPGNPGPWPTGRHYWSDSFQWACAIEMQAWMAGQLKDEDYIGAVEACVVEPSPTGYGDAAIRAKQIQAMDNWLAHDRKMIFIVGGNSYGSGKTAQAVFPGRKAAATCDLFNFSNNPDYHGSFASRLAQVVAVRDDSNVPAFIQQVGVRLGDSPDRAILQDQMDQLVAAGIPAAQWEVRAPGPGVGTYGWINGASGSDVFRQTDPAILARAAASFKAMLGAMPA